MRLILITLVLFISTRSNATGLEFFLNGVAKPVKVDTVTPANSTPYPMRIYQSNGVIANPALESTQQSVLAQLGLIYTRQGLELTALQLQLTELQQINTNVADIEAGQGLLATESTLQSVSAQLPANLGQKTMANSFAVTLASNQTAIPITNPSAIISTANSSVTPLGIAGVFTGTGEDTLQYSSITVSVFANQVSAASGLSLQQSTNNTNWDIMDAYTIPASTGKTFSVTTTARYFRIVYTNGGVAQGTFRLQTIYHYNPVKGSTHSLADTITLQNDAELNIAQMRATNGLNSVAVTADAASNLNVNLAASAMGANFGAATTALRTASIIGNATAVADFNAGAASAQTLRVVSASNSPAAPPPAAVTVKQAAISVGTTAVRLTTDAAAPSATRRRLEFQQDQDSVANCYYGSATVTTTSTTRGVRMFPAATKELIDDVNDYYVICDVAAQTVYIVEAE